MVRKSKKKFLEVQQKSVRMIPQKKKRRTWKVLFDLTGNWGSKSYHQSLCFSNTMLFSKTVMNLFVFKKKLIVQKFRNEKIHINPHVVAIILLIWSGLTQAEFRALLMFFFQTCGKTEQKTFSLSTVSNSRFNLLRCLSKVLFSLGKQAG